MEITIFGAGPVGSYAAYLLSKAGFKVVLFDQKKVSQIGLPVQCTGLLTEEIKQFLPLDSSFLINSFSGIEVFSPAGRKICLNKTEFLVDRKKFDQHLLTLAVNAGANFYPQHRLIKVEKNSQGKVNLIVQNKNKLKVISPQVLIGADGPLSLVRQYLNPTQKKKFYYGLQALVKGNFNPQAYSVFLGAQVCPGLFGWLVPESKAKARIGLATSGNVNFYFNRFLKTLKIDKKQIIEKQGGLIPIFNPQLKITDEKTIFLLGDAASQVKATTLGGIVPGFQAARALAQSLSQNRRYQPNLKILKLHLFLRKILDRFSDKDYCRLIYLLSKPSNKKLLELYSRENPKKLLQKLLFHEPRLLFFLKYLI